MNRAQTALFLACVLVIQLAFMSYVLPQEGFFAFLSDQTDYWDEAPHKLALFSLLVAAAGQSGVLLLLSYQRSRVVAALRPLFLFFALGFLTDLLQLFIPQMDTLRLAIDLSLLLLTALTLISTFRSWSHAHLLPSQHRLNQWRDRHNHDSEDSEVEEHQMVDFYKQNQEYRRYILLTLERYERKVLSRLRQLQKSEEYRSLKMGVTSLINDLEREGIESGAASELKIIRSSILMFFDSNQTYHFDLRLDPSMQIYADPVVLLRFIFEMNRCCKEWIADDANLKHTDILLSIKEEGNQYTWTWTSQHRYLEFNISETRRRSMEELVDIQRGLFIVDKYRIEFILQKPYHVIAQAHGLNDDGEEDE